MFKVGDKVRFKDNFRDINRGRGVSFLSGMKNLINKDLTVRSMGRSDSEGIIHNCYLKETVFSINIKWLELVDPIIDISGI